MRLNFPDTVVRICIIPVLLYYLGAMSWPSVYAQATLHLSPSGQVHLGGAQLVLDSTHLINTGTLNAAAATLHFNGPGEVNLRSNGTIWHNVHNNKSAGGINLLDDTGFTGTWNLAGFVTLHNHDLVLHGTAQFLQGPNTHWIETNGTGEVVATQYITSFYYPVGPDRTHYHPTDVYFQGPLDTFGLRCLPEVYTQGLTGNSLTTDVVQVSWLLSEKTSGGNTASPFSAWQTIGRERPGFDRNDCGVMHYQNGRWNLPVTRLGSAGNLGQINGQDYVFQSATIDSVGVFAVGGAKLVDRVPISARAYLQGPFQFGSMTDQLRSRGLIPLQEPYTALGYTHYGRGGGEVIDTSVLLTTGLDAIVDWVVLELWDQANPDNILETCSALLQRDGDIVDIDGTSPVGIPVLDNNYYLAVRHRNHLGIRTPQFIGLSKATVSTYDFTIASAQAFGNNPMTEVAPDQWSMWGGNVNGDAMVRMTGPGFINDFTALLSAAGGSTGVLFGVYDRGDVNLDGNIRLSGPPTINDFSRLLSFLGGFTHIRFEQL